MFRKLLALALVTLPAAGQAKWMRAESSHFVVMADSDPAALKLQTEKLEKFTYLVGVLSGRKVMDTPEKLTIYNVATVQDMLGTMVYPSYGVGAYYKAQLRHSFIVTPKRLYSSGQMINTNRASVATPDIGADDVFFHELSHHLMFQNAAYAYPAWYSEGFADYYGTIKIGADNRVEIGGPQHARIALFRETWLPIRKLLAGRNYADAGDNIGSLYAQGWILIHYCANNKERGAQMRKYLADINANVPYDKAAEAFGDLGVLDRELQNYSAKSIPIMRVGFKELPAGNVTVREMTPAEVALWKNDLKLSGGLPRRELAAFVSEVRRDVAASPRDPYALRILTETEDFAGHPAEAGAALDRWLAVAPQDPLALMYRGKFAAKAAQRAKASATDPVWQAARADLLAALKLAPRNPRILQAYYQSYVDAGVMPPAGAQAGLMQALRIVPQDDDLRLQVAGDFEKREMIDDAITIVRPAAVQVKPETEKTNRDKQRDARSKKMLRGEYAIVGLDPDAETSRDMYERLLKKSAKTDPGVAAEAKAVATDKAADKAGGS